MQIIADNVHMYICVWYVCVPRGPGLYRPAPYQLEASHGTPPPSHIHYTTHPP